jgi:hypothetical protein
MMLATAIRALRSGLDGTERRRLQEAVIRLLAEGARA